MLFTGALNGMTSLPPKKIQPKRNSNSLRRAEPPARFMLWRCEGRGGGCDSLDYATDRDDVEAKLNKYYKR